MGRPREFEPKEALEAIKAAFWRHGNDGASINDIEAATGVKKQSLYRQFGDKHAMYLASLDDYERQEMEAAKVLLAEQGTARRRIERLFENLIAERDQRGCFLCNASVDQAQADVITRTRVAEMMEGWIAAIGEALAASSVYLSNARLCERKAAQIAAAYMGLRIMIKAGMPEKTLRAAAAETLATV